MQNRLGLIVGGVGGDEYRAPSRSAVACKKA